MIYQINSARLFSTDTAFCHNIASKARLHFNGVFEANGNTVTAANAFFIVDYCLVCSVVHLYFPNFEKTGAEIFFSAPASVSLFNYRTFLFSAPGVVTITFSGVIINAPFAVAAPLNIFSTIALNVSTTAPSLTYSAVPLIW